jgi:hypothetical protein
VCALALLALVPGISRGQPGAAPPQPYPPSPPQLTPEEADLLARGEISTEETVAGGLVGTFFGLGLGHAVQGRYLDKGWIFTVGELGSLTVMVIGVSQCIDNDDGCDDGGGLLILGGFVAALGFRVWELIDVWAAPSSHNARVRALRLRLGYPPPQPVWGLHLAPARGGDGGKLLGLTFRF